MSPHTRRPITHSHRPMPPYSHRPKPPRFHRPTPPHQRRMTAPYPLPPPVPTAPFGTPVLAPAPTVAGCPPTILPPPPPVSIASCPTPVLAPAPAKCPPTIPPPDIIRYVEYGINHVLGDAFQRTVNRAVESAVGRAIINAVDRAINRDVEDMYKLFVGQLDWSEAHIVQLTSTQHRMLSKISPSHWKGCDPICMDVLDFAGRLCSTQHYGNSPASKFVYNLFCVTQDKFGMTEEGSPLYWNHRIVSLLNKRVEIEIDGESYSGILVGAAAPEGSQLPSHVYEIQLFQSETFTLDLQKLIIGNAKIRELGETDKETRNLKR